MAYYQQRGSVPPKRHTQHRDEQGRLYFEELMGEEGFSSDSSLLYHREIPSALVDVRTWVLPDQQTVPNEPLMPMHLRLPELFKDADVETTDAVTGRRLILGNDDVRIYYVVAGTDSPLYRNAIGDECVYVESGAATLETIFGPLAARQGDYVLLPRATTHRWLPDTAVMGDTFPIFSFQFLWVMTFQIAAFTMHVRHLRTMPVSATKLAGVLVFTALAAMLLTFYGAMLLLSAVFQSPLPGPEKIIQQGTLLPIAVTTCVVPLFVWRPMEKITFIIIVGLMGSGMFAAFFKQGLPPGITVAASVVIVLGAFVATKALIERNSRAYRPRTTNQFGAWNMGGGR